METQSEFLFGDVLWEYLRLRSLDKRDNILPGLYQDVEAEKGEEAGARVWESDPGRDLNDRYYQ